MQAKDIMTSAVICISEDGPVTAAVRKMLDHRISALPVIDAKGKLVGLVSEGDLMRRIRDPGAPRRSWWLELLGGSARDADEFVLRESRHVADIMTRKVVTVTEETPVSAIARLLEKHRIKRVPVVRDGRVVGIVSRANLMHALASAPETALRQPSTEDQMLRLSIEEALKQVPGTAANLIYVAVENGAVTLSGSVESDAEERAIRVAVENVHGVKSVAMDLSHLPVWAYGV